MCWKVLSKAKKQKAIFFPEKLNALKKMCVKYIEL